MAPEDGNAWAIRKAKEAQAQARARELHQQQRNEDHSQGPHDNFKHCEPAAIDLNTELARNTTSTISSSSTAVTSSYSSEKPHIQCGSRNFNGEVTISMPKQKSARSSEETITPTSYSSTFEKKTQSETSKPVKRVRISDETITTTYSPYSWPSLEEKKSGDDRPTAKRSLTDGSVATTTKPHGILKPAKRSFTDPFNRRARKSEKAKAAGGDPGPEHSYWEPDEKPGFFQALRSKLSLKELARLGHKSAEDENIGPWMKVADYLDIVDPGWRKDIEVGIAIKKGIWRLEPEKKKPDPNPKYPNCGIWRAQYPKNHKPCTWTGPPSDDGDSDESGEEALLPATPYIEDKVNAGHYIANPNHGRTGNESKENAVPSISDRLTAASTVQHMAGNPVAQHKPVVANASASVPARQSGLLGTFEHKPSKAAENKPLVEGSRSMSTQSQQMQKHDPHTSTEYNSLATDGPKRVVSFPKPSNTAEAKQFQFPANKHEQEPIKTTENKTLVTENSKNVFILPQNTQQHGPHKPTVSFKSGHTVEAKHSRSQSHEPEQHKSPVANLSNEVPGRRRDRPVEMEDEDHLPAKDDFRNHQLCIFDGELLCPICPTVLNPGQIYSPSVYGVSGDSSSIRTLDLQESLTQPLSLAEQEGCRQMEMRYDLVSPFVALADHPPRPAPSVPAHPTRPAPSIPAPTRPAPSVPALPDGGQPPTASNGAAYSDGVSYHNARRSSRGGHAPTPPAPPYSNMATLEDQLASHMAELHSHVEKTTSRLSKSFEDNKTWHMDRIRQQVDEMSDIARLINAKTIAQEETLNQTQRMMKEIRTEMAAVRQDVQNMESRVTSLVREEVAKLCEGIQSLKTGGGPRSPAQEERPWTGLQGPYESITGDSTTGVRYEQRPSSIRQRSRLSGRSMLKLELSSVLNNREEKERENNTEEAPVNRIQNESTPVTPASFQSEIPSVSAEDPLALPHSATESECVSELRVAAEPALAVPNRDLSDDILSLARPSTSTSRTNITESSITIACGNSITSSNSGAGASTTDSGSLNSTDRVKRTKLSKPSAFAEGEVNPADYPDLDPAIAATMKCPSQMALFGHRGKRKKTKNPTATPTGAELPELPPDPLRAKAQRQPRDEPKPKTHGQLRRGLNTQRLLHRQDEPNKEHEGQSKDKDKSKSKPVKDPRTIDPDLRTPLEQHLVRAIIEADPMIPWEVTVRNEMQKHAESTLTGSAETSLKSRESKKTLRSVDSEATLRPDPFFDTRSEFEARAARHYDQKWVAKKYHNCLTKPVDPEKELKPKKSGTKLSRTLGLGDNDEPTRRTSKDSSIKSVTGLSIRTKMSKSDKSGGSSVKSHGSSHGDKASIGQGVSTPPVPSMPTTPTVPSMQELGSEMSSMTTAQAMGSDASTNMVEVQEASGSNIEPPMTAEATVSTFTSPTVPVTRSPAYPVRTSSLRTSTNMPSLTTSIPTTPTTPRTPRTPRTLGQVTHNADWGIDESQGDGTWRDFWDPDSNDFPAYRPGMFDHDPMAGSLVPRPPPRTCVTPVPDDLPEYLRAYHERRASLEEPPIVDYARGNRHRDASIYTAEADDVI
ncbi:uncharacterized protein BP01DRAFT_391760 [Aspergillus saccharolyticus JOP 1030-1]|uniref:Uncharacterized protein n=1 Tax=Aspergillus saccharolyticus JOP 1030-1 TaxID=1450539 RepID=A0A318ZGX2_9EURO|nr:hypothetical protein BP01DRAFT_391760 [Aspergillus saccharolyticus JOP 1030-1]PYH45614.1 hypothetical protein BP01DRAFT_391760 [Aspergillus saccharolyticus JOP 1030-1]